jgi:hypothetical protein
VNGRNPPTGATPFSVPRASTKTAQEKIPLKPFSNGCASAPGAVGVRNAPAKTYHGRYLLSKKDLRFPHLAGHLSTIPAPLAPILPIIPVVFATHFIFRPKNPVVFAVDQTTRTVKTLHKSVYVECGVAPHVKAVFRLC